MLTWAVVVLNRVHVTYLLVWAWYGDSVWEVALLEVAHASPLTSVLLVSCAQSIG